MLWLMHFQHLHVKAHHCLEVAVFQVGKEIPSLLVASSIVDGSSPSDIGHEQRKDPKLQEMISWLENGTLPEDDKRARNLVIRAEQFTILDDILYFVDPNKSFS